MCVRPGPPTKAYESSYQSPMMSTSSWNSPANGGMSDLNEDCGRAPYPFGRETSLSCSQGSDSLACSSDGRFSNVSLYTTCAGNCRTARHMDLPRQETFLPSGPINHGSQDSWWDFEYDPGNTFSPSLPAKDSNLSMWDPPWLFDAANDCGDGGRQTPTSCLLSMEPAQTSFSPIMKTLSSTPDQVFDIGLGVADGDLDDFGLSSGPLSYAVSRSTSLEISSPRQYRHLSSSGQPTGHQNPGLGENNPVINQGVGSRRRPSSPKVLHPKPAAQINNNQDGSMVSGTWPTRHKIQRMRNPPKTKQTQTLDPRDTFLIESKMAGKSYKQIKDEGKFTEAESTLRGRFRTLTKAKERRVRKPEWEEGDVRPNSLAAHAKEYEH